MILGDVENILKQAMGLDTASIGISAVERAVQERLSAYKLSELTSYVELLRGSKTELQALIEAIVVSETWFFRDREAFTALARIACEEWLPAHPQGALNLLSLPCSTGEEPYSMAMVLLDAGFPAQRFRIHAIDISARVVDLAAEAVYGKNSFRGNDLGFRDRHFEATARGHHVAEAVRRQVRFQQGNLFDADFLPGSEIYDVIFCRNVLIYFDRITQDRAIDVLARLLTAKGVIFVAPSETGLMLSHDFTSEKVPLAFAFRKASAGPRSRKSESVRAVKLPAAVEKNTPRAPTPKTSSVQSITSTVAAPSKSVAPSASLDEIQRLADQGHLAEAAKCCEQHVRAQGPSAQAFYLLGLIRDAGANHIEAAELYRKALYLDPQHHEALVHLAFLLEQQGDSAAANLLHQRARRLEKKRGK
ncbi:MAG: hypothetical protein HY308_17200 [Gammaproteobacteria bacterium]|nr:hypothetical protein [Gammaproteobacteria bacterium]